MTIHLSHKLSIRGLITLFIGLTFLLAGGCSQQSTVPNQRSESTDRPGWVLEPEVNYPASQYLTGIGEGNSLTEAKNAARGELAKIFRQRINVDETLDEQIKEVVDKNQRTFREETNLNTRIRVQSDQELMGVTIAQSECVRPNGSETCYALAVLNRSEARRTYRAELDSTLTGAQNLYRQSRELDRARRKLRYLGTAELLLRRADQLGKKLRILGGQPPEIRPSRSTLQEDRRAILQTLPVYVEEPTVPDKLDGGKFDKNLRSWVQDRFSSLGFPVQHSGEAPVAFRVRIDHGISSIDLGRPGLVTLNSQTSITVVDETVNKTLLNWEATHRTTALNRKQAHARAVNRLENGLDDEFVPKLERKLMRLDD